MADDDKEITGLKKNTAAEGARDAAEQELDVKNAQIAVAEQRHL